MKEEFFFAARLLKKLDRKKSQIVDVICVWTGGSINEFFLKKLVFRASAQKPLLG